MNSKLLTPDISKQDLENRGFVVTETPNGSMTLVVVTKDGPEVGRMERVGREAIWLLREILIGGETLLFCLTTAQRDAIASPPTGLPIINLTSNRRETYTGAQWEPARAMGPKRSTFGSPFTSPSVAAAGGVESFNITGWGALGLLLHSLSILPSTDVDLYTVELYREDTFTTKQYELKDVNTSAAAAVKQTDSLIGLMLDDDESGELHMRITNDDPVNAATFGIEAEGIDISG